MLTQLQHLAIYLRARTGTLHTDEQGATLLEYVIIAALISVAAVIVVDQIIGKINGATNRITVGG